MPFPYLLSSCLTVLRPLLFLRRPPVSHRIAVAAERAEDIQHAGRATQDEEEQQHPRLRVQPRVEQNADSHPDPDRGDQLDPDTEGESQATFSRCVLRLRIGAPRLRLAQPRVQIIQRRRGFAFGVRPFVAHWPAASEPVDALGRRLPCPKLAPQIETARKPCKVDKTEKR